MPEQILLNYSMDLATDNTYKVLGPEGGIILMGFLAIATTYAIFLKDNEKYTHWKNPKGKEVNLVRLMRIILWGYTGIVIIAFLVQKFILGG